MAFKMAGFSPLTKGAPVYSLNKNGKMTYYTNDDELISKQRYLDLLEKWKNK